MTSTAIKLARELCICAVVDGRIVPAMPSEGLFIRQLETFYAKAQAQALENAAEWFDERGDEDWFSGGVRDELRRMAEELERGA